MTANALFNAYLDANIVLFLAACIWAITRFALHRTSLRHAFSTQLQMIYGALVTVVLAPVIVFGFQYATGQGWIDARYSVNFSDFVVSQFLYGHISMAPSSFESMLSTRDILIWNVTTLGSVWGAAVAFGLVAGTLFFAWKGIHSALRVSGLVRTSYLWRKIGRVEIRLTHRTQMPFSTRGIRTHYIIIPSGLLAEADDLRIAIAHELQHMRQQDLFWEIALEILRPLFFWNPAFGFWKHEVEKLRELACDQNVLRRHAIGARAYCECLLRICHNSIRKGSGQLMVPTVPFVQIDRSRTGGKSARFLKFRVLSILDNSRLQPSQLLTFGLIGVLTFTIVFGTIISQRSGDWSQDRLMLSAIVNLERRDVRNSSGQ